jgi:hypothetical protein
MDWLAVDSDQWMDSIKRKSLLFIFSHAGKPEAFPHSHCGIAAIEILFRDHEDREEEFNLLRDLRDLCNLSGLIQLKFTVNRPL